MNQNSQPGGTKDPTIGMNRHERRRYLKREQEEAGRKRARRNERKQGR